MSRRLGAAQALVRSLAVDVEQLLLGDHGSPRPGRADRQFDRTWSRLVRACERLTRLEQGSGNEPRRAA